MRFHRREQHTNVVFDTHSILVPLRVAIALHLTLAVSSAHATRDSDVGGLHGIERTVRPLIHAALAARPLSNIDRPVRKIRAVQDLTPRAPSGLALYKARVPARDRPVGHTAFGAAPDLELSILSDCRVTSIDDSGVGTLRACLMAAQPGDRIVFDEATFPSDVPRTIRLAGPLPAVTVDDVAIDASNAGVILDGSSIDVPDGQSSVGVDIVGARRVRVSGLRVHGFTFGITLSSAAAECVIGAPDAAWTLPSGRNTLYGNTFGIAIFGTDTHSNSVTGNLIGLDADGTVPQAEQVTGVTIGGGAAHNRIEGNVIAANTNGAILSHSMTADNRVINNRIGTNLRGDAAADRTQVVGVLIQEAARQNIVGGDRQQEGNTIAGNRWGIEILGTGTRENEVAGNRIGLTVDGTRAIGGDRHGILIAMGASDNVIGSALPNRGNTIAGHIEGLHILEPGSNGNVVLNNRFGANEAGTEAIGSKNIGIAITKGALGNHIGQAGAGNIVVGYQYGILISDAGTDNNVVEGNLIGLFQGTPTLAGNTSNGVLIQDQSNGNRIGGPADGQGNVIGGSEIGIDITLNSSRNRIQGNRVGTDASGMSARANLYGIVVSGSSANEIGGSAPGEGNVVSGNDYSGIALGEVGTVDNTILGNLIGTTADGQAALPNRGNGIELNPGVTNTRIGSPAAPNVVSGNGGIGILVTGAGANRNVVLGNRVGTTRAGTAPLSNGKVGIGLSSGAQRNRIGGLNNGDGNVISGNTNGLGLAIYGQNTSHNEVRGNRIGLGAGASTDASTANLMGLALQMGASDNLIVGNVIGHNTQINVMLAESGTTRNRLERNLVGEDEAGNPIPSPIGVVFVNGAKDNAIGGATVADGNVVAHQSVVGIGFVDAASVPNVVTRSRIFDNVENIYYEVPVASAPARPVLQAYSEVGARIVTGSACADCTVELYANPNPGKELTHFVGTAWVDRSGGFAARVRAPLVLMKANPHLTAFARRPGGHISTVSESLATNPAADLYNLAMPLTLQGQALR
ncbi:MAG: hypothetical protein IT332_13115 [Ardenticatenales bacterium]|nr:hypothetical protein [Ardenticatenales bacterium]